MSVMKLILPVIVSVLLCFSSHAQVVITSADMPVAGDTLRYSNASLAGAVIPPGDSGISMVWNYGLSYASQGIDTYKTAFTVSPLYALTVGISAYGYKVADSFPGPVPIRQVYTFFENNADSFMAKSFAANVSGVPAASNYAPADVLYHFPMTYKYADSNDYALHISIPSLGGIDQHGTRYARVDAWGTLTTPYSSGMHCIRVRSVIYEMDSVTFGASGFPPVPRNRVEYKWLANGEHYPILWVTSSLAGGTETITSIRYRDINRDTASPPPIDTNVGVNNISAAGAVITAYPNPAAEGIVKLSIPANWKKYYVQIYDIQARQMAKFVDKCELDLRSLPCGRYLALITSGDNVAYVQLVR